MMLIMILESLEYLLIALLIGVVAKVIIDIIKKSDNPVVYLFYGQIAVYLALAFFYNMVQQSCDMVLADHYRE